MNKSDTRLIGNAEQPFVNLTCGACSMPGRRIYNEDSAAALVCANGTQSNIGLAVVADGVGGNAGGEIASPVAVAGVLTHIPSAILTGFEAFCGAEELLRDAVRAAAVAVERSTTDECPEMGTTLAVALVHESTVYSAGIGDSRVYLLRGSRIHQLTRDDSYVEELVAAGLLSSDEARGHPMDNVITRCIGSGEFSAEVDVVKHELLPGDAIVVTSDGCHKLVDRLLVRSLTNSSPKEQARWLVETAYESGSDDNISAAILWFGDPGMRPGRRRTLTYFQKGSSHAKSL